MAAVPRVCEVFRPLSTFAPAASFCATACQVTFTEPTTSFATTTATSVIETSSLTTLTSTFTSSSFFSVTAILPLITTFTTDTTVVTVTATETRSPVKRDICGQCSTYVVTELIPRTVTGTRKCTEKGTTILEKSIYDVKTQPVYAATTFPAAYASLVYPQHSSPYARTQPSSPAKHNSPYAASETLEYGPSSAAQPTYPGHSPVHSSMYTEPNPYPGKISTSASSYAGRTSTQRGYPTRSADCSKSVRASPRPSASSRSIVALSSSMRSSAPSGTFLSASARPSGISLSASARPSSTSFSASAQPSGNSIATSSATSATPSSIDPLSSLFSSLITLPASGRVCSCLELCGTITESPVVTVPTTTIVSTTATNVITTVISVTTTTILTTTISVTPTTTVTSTTTSTTTATATMTTCPPIPLLCDTAISVGAGLVDSLTTITKRTKGLFDTARIADPNSINTSPVTVTVNFLAQIADLIDTLNGELPTASLTTCDQIALASALSQLVNAQQTLLGILTERAGILSGNARVGVSIGQSLTRFNVAFNLLIPEISARVPSVRCQTVQLGESLATALTAALNAFGVK